MQRAEQLVREALDLLNIFRTTGATFEAQARVRDKLYQSVCERLFVYPIPGFEEFLSRYHAQFDDYEYQLFATIRSFTEHVLFEYNSRALSIIQNNPELKNSCPQLNQMETHLIVWLSKYHGVFLKNSYMGLVYVGVDEAVPFPDEAVYELWKYLMGQEDLADLISLEPHPLDVTEEVSFPGQDFRWDEMLKFRWTLKRLNELESKEQDLIGQSKIKNMTTETKRDFCRVNRKYAELILSIYFIHSSSLDKTFNGEDKVQIWNKLAKPFADILKCGDEILYEQFNENENYRWQYLEKINDLVDDQHDSGIRHSLNRMLVGLWISHGVSQEKFIEVLLDLICKVYIPDQVDDFYQAWVALRSRYKLKLEELVE